MRFGHVAGSSWIEMAGHRARTKVELCGPGVERDHGHDVERDLVEPYRGGGAPPERRPTTL